MSEYCRVADELEPGRCHISDEVWKGRAQAWVDRAIVALGSRDAWIDWILQRELYCYRVPFGKTRAWTSHPGDPRLDGDENDRAAWLHQIRGYAWSQMVAGVTPEQAVAEGPSVLHENRVPTPQK